MARPGPHRGGGPLEDVAARVERLHRFAWSLAHSDLASVPALANLAVIGTMLGSAAARAHLRAAHDSRDGRGHDDLVAAAARARRAADQWAVIVGRLQPLRTLHPPTTVLQIERLDLSRLLERTSSRAWAEDPARTADVLARACDRWAGVATLSATAFRRAHDRGEVFLMGRALPGEVVSRHPELLQAKLTDRPIPAPTVVVRRIEAAYRAVGSDRPATPSRGVPAA